MAVTVRGLAITVAGGVTVAVALVLVEESAEEAALLVTAIT